MINLNEHLASYDVQVAHLATEIKFETDPNKRKQKH